MNHHPELMKKILDGHLLLFSGGGYEIGCYWDGYSFWGMILLRRGMVGSPDCFIFPVQQLMILSGKFAWIQFHARVGGSCFCGYVF